MYLSVNTFRYLPLGPYHQLNLGSCSCQSRLACSCTYQLSPVWTLQHLRIWVRQLLAESGSGRHQSQCTTLDIQPSTSMKRLVALLKISPGGSQAQFMALKGLFLADVSVSDLVCARSLLYDFQLCVLFLSFSTSLSNMATSGTVPAS